MNGVPIRNPIFFPLCLAVGLSGCAADASADSSEAALAGEALGAEPEGGPRRGPPPEAFAACEDKAAGDDCTVSLPDREVQGECVAPPPDAPDDRLVCRPDDMPPPPDGRCPPGPPPPEAVEACEGHDAGDACTVTVDGRDPLDGICTPPPGGREGPLACAPPLPAGVASSAS